MGRGTIVARDGPLTARMHGAIETPRQFLQALKIETIVLLGKEARRAVIAALDDVPGHAGKV